MPAAAPPIKKPAATPPAPIVEDIAAPANIKEFMPTDFVPSDDDDIGAPIAITPKPPTSPPTPGPTPPVPPKGLTKEEKARQNADLRSQLEESNRKAREAEAALAEKERLAQERIDALQKERDELDSRYKETHSKFEELNRTVSMDDPYRSEEVQAIVGPWNQRVASIAKDISDTRGNGKQFNSMLPDLIKSYKDIGDEASDGYENRREAFNQMVNQFPDHTKEIRELVRNGIEVQTRARQVMQEMSTNGETYRYQRDRKQWDALASDFAKDEMKFFSPAPEVREADPYNAEVLVTELLSGSDEGKKRMEQIKRFTRFVSLPLPPVNPDEIAKMTNEDAAKFFEGRQRQHQDNQLKLRRLLPTALAAQQLLPGLMKRNQELEEQLAAIRGGTPPPRLSDDGSPTPADEITDVRKFTPANPVLDDFKKDGRR